MNWLKNFFSKEAGQERRAWLDETTADFADDVRYYAGPGFSGALDRGARAVNFLNPVQDIEDAVSASRMAQARDMGFDVSTPLFHKDPRLKHLANLSAGVAGGAIALDQMTEQELLEYLGVR